MDVQSESQSFMTINATPVLADFEDDDDPVTPAQILAEMKLAWKNEVNAPVLLPHKFEIARCLVDQIEGMEENIQTVQEKVKLKIGLHRSELQRITYLVNDYIRLRLEKIEANARNALKEHEKRLSEKKSALLDENEVAFAVRLVNAQAKLFGKSFLGRIPASFRKVLVMEPETSSRRVLVQVKDEEVESVWGPNYTDQNSMDEVHLDPNTIHLVSLDAVREHIEKGKVSLL